MIKEDYADLISDLPTGWSIPEDFFENIFVRNDCYCYLMNCTGAKKYYQLGTPCEEITGFTPAEFAKGGIEFWFSRVHPGEYIFCHRGHYRRIQSAGRYSWSGRISGYGKAEISLSDSSRKLAQYIRNTISILPQ